MTDGTFTLLARKRFLPLFVTQFLGAANDNLYKNAMAMLIIYRIGDAAGLSAAILTTIATGLFMLPYFLFSATAGELADRYEKSRLMKLVKFGEIVIVLLGAVGLFLANVPLLLAALFLLGTQATFFGPLKYAVLPEHLGAGELIGGNGLIEGGTFLAILIGTIVGDLLILGENGAAFVSVLLLALAIGGFVSSLFLPPARPGDPTLRINRNPVTATTAVLRSIRHSRDVFLSVLGISWFWAMGATFLTEFPAYAKDVLGANEQVVTLMLAMFSIGIGLGSVVCSRLLRGEISARHVPAAAIGMALFSLDLFLASGHAHAEPGVFVGFVGFIGQPSSWRILFDLLMVASCGGLYIVPLYAILQSRTVEAERARAIAANNVVNALFMVVISLVAAVLLAAGIGVTHLFLLLGIANVLVAIYICKLLPDAFLRGILSSLLKLAYGVEIQGLDNMRQAGERVVVIANHVSFIDALLIAVFLPGKPVFAIDTFMAKRWWVKPFLGLVESFPLDPTNPMSIKHLTRKVREGNVCVIFPEGRLTHTGALMKIYEGPGLIADRADAAIVPVRIDGAQYTPFSRLKGKVHQRWFPKITLTVLPPQRLEMPPELVGRKRRQRAGAVLYDLMSQMVFETGDRDRTLFAALLEARRTHGGDAPIIEDIERKPVSYDRLTQLSLTLGRYLARRTRPGETVALLLPNASGAVATFFALQAYGRVPAMLNFTTGAGNVMAACRAAGATKIICSRRFIEQARLGALADALAQGTEIIWLEEVRGALSLGDKLHGLLARPFAARLHARLRMSAAVPAVILFTSGSEGTPKGVALSHSNILANCLQLSARVDFNAADTVFNALPLFHSFGLTGGLLLPVLSGVKSFLYPSPLHYRIVPELVYDTSATIVFGTNTFLTGYAKQANAYDFYSVRYIFAGAEKIEDKTRAVYAEKFGLRILEGYGVTEMSPVIAVNTPMHYRAGTVGKFLPGIESRIEPVPGIAEGGRLFLRGPNRMLGYLRAERPGEIEPPPDGWHDTGDIVTIDEDGFVRIAGRAKRFAKIAGEMVPLARIEAEAAALWPDHLHAAIAVPDPRKGEQLVLATDTPNATRAALLEHFRKQGLAELLVPRRILTLEKLPLLGTGKIDYVAIGKLAEDE